MKTEILCHVGMFKAASTFIQSILQMLDEPILQPRDIYTWTVASTRFPFIVPELYQAVQGEYQQKGRFGIEYRVLRPELHDQPVNMYALAEYLALFGDKAPLQRLNHLLHNALTENSVHKLVCSHEDLVCGGWRHCDAAQELVPKRNQVITGLKQDKHDYELNRHESNLLLERYRESNARLFDHFLASDSPDQKWRSYYLGDI